MYIKFLGSGTSHGVPIVGCNCPTCISDNPQNKRYRAAVHLKYRDNSILIDTPPELRLQLLENQITRVDAILFTHPHADHIMGFDDIRAINRLQKGEIPCYGNEITIDKIKNIFDYIFNPIQIGGGLPRVKLIEIQPLVPFYLSDIKITPLPVKHGKLDILGYKIGKFAYLTDCNQIPDSTLSLLEDVKLLVLDALRFKTHPTHFNIEQALQIINKLNVDRAFLTHISHHLEHEKTNRILPDNVKLAYDGLSFTLKEGEK